MSISSNRWQRLFAVIAVFVMVTATFSFQSAAASSSSKPAPAYKALTGKAQPPVGFAVSQPLSALAEKMQKPQTDWRTPVEGNNAVHPFVGGKQIPHQVGAGNSLNFSDLQSNRPVIDPKKKLFDTVSPALDKAWAGLSQGVNRAWYSYGVYPPDTNGDVGPNNYIQLVNIQMEIWDLNQTTQSGTPLPLFVGPINVLWKGSGLTDCVNSEDGDPVVVYDEQADRWLVSQFALTNYPNALFYECIAVSTTGNPMGTWSLYQYSFPVMNDYPKFGVWHDGYYMSMNQFASGTGAWSGQGVVAFDRATMLTGGAASMIYIDTSAACVLGSEPECVLGGMLPSDADGSTVSSGNQVFMQFDDNAWGYSPDQLQLWEMVPNWVAGTATFTHLVNLPTNPFISEVCPGYSRNCLPQLGTAQGLDAISDRLMYRLQYRDFGTYKAMVVNHTVDVSGAGQAGIRWYELRNAGGGWSIYQQGDVAPDASNRWMGSAAMDDVGNIALGYSVTDATMYPSIRYSTHLASDPLGTMRAETNMVTGGGAQTGSGARWGDYSQMSVYPQASSGCEFFYTQEYLRGTSPAEWYTWLGKFHNTSCSTGDITAPDTTIDSHPSDGTFTFSGADNVAVASYECSLDGAAFAACTSPITYSTLTAGSHTFDVRAIDTSNNVDATPATQTWSIVPTSAQFNSVGAQDGWVLESAQNSFVGGSMNAVAATFNVGDDAANKQYRGVLSFNTSTLPPTAVVTSATLKVKQSSMVGTPFTGHGLLVIDIRKPFFGPVAGLQGTDFEASADAMGGSFSAVPNLNWYTGTLNAAGRTFINQTGLTQFRLRFQLDTNDAAADYMSFFSGNNVVSLAPLLTVEYYVP